MKILIVNKYDDKGGAAIAAKRLHKALEEQGVSVNFLAQESGTENSLSTTKNFIKEKINFLRFSFERLKIYMHINDKKNLFAFDSASFGEDISSHHAVQEADIIHLHWINFGFLSLKSIEKLLKLNKKIVWTFHDIWPITGGCFYSNDCLNYSDNCNNCHFLKEKSTLAKKIFSKKKNLYKNSNLQIVALCKWIKDSVEKSVLLSDKEISLLPNPIDTKLFKPEEKQIVRKRLGLKNDKIYLGFIAFNVNDERKGAKYLKESLLKLFEKKPELSEKIELIAIGKIKDETFFGNLPVKYTAYINDTKKMIDYYNAFDIMLLPSLEDNVPLVVQEAMACKTPLVAFNIGGIPDMIDHKKSGYLAKAKDTSDFVDGIEFCAENKDFLSKNAREKVEKEFSNEIVAKKYIEFYKTILEKN